jgi:hypothetical protein
LKERNERFFYEDAEFPDGSVTIVSPNDLGFCRRKGNFTAYSRYQTLATNT